MSKLMSFFKQLNLRRIVTVFLAGLSLVLLTACNNGDVRGARPNNAPVQMGGQNNPHKAGGDSYTNYKMSTDPRVRAGHPVTERDPNTDPRVNRFYLNQPSDRSDANLSGLIASSVVDLDPSDIQYESNRQHRQDFGRKTYGKSGGENNAPQSIPAPRQKVIDRSNPDEHILENIGEQFKESTEFVRDGLDSAAGSAFKDERVQGRTLQGQNSVSREGY